MKGTARAKHEKGVRRRVVGKIVVPRNWQNFLQIDSNKAELFRLQHCIHFGGHGKNTSWSTWKSLLEPTDALFMLADGPKEIPKDAINIIGRFVILLFGRTSTYTNVDHPRRKLIPRKTSV